MLITITKKTLSSIFSPDFLGTILISMTLALLFLIGFMASVHFVLSATAFFTDGMLEQAIDWILQIGAGMLAWLLFPVMLPLIASFFQEKVATTIEKQDYPKTKPKNPAKFLENLPHDLRFILWAITLNILAIPLYFVPLINAVIYYILNGYLIGREFFEMSASRFMSREEAKTLRIKHRLPIYFSGALIVFTTNFPILNLIMPLIALTFMVHMFQFIYIREK